ncbi:hypothetical protein O6H91_08G006800 [Diphasiastrum complanatum]|nr:hypothetical protein O6H91_08G006800 [Diphasiastrum complanatum]
MQRLMKRRAGEVVDGSVLYADVKTPKANVGSSGVNWLRGALNSVPIIVETPSLRILGTQTAIYSVLMALTYANGLVSSTGSSFQDTRADAPGLILAIGFGASLLFLRKQRLTLGKAAAVTTASLVAGAVVGGMVESWLRVDIVPVFGVGSPAVLVSEFVLLSLWLASLYLR